MMLQSKLMFAYLNYYCKSARFDFLVNLQNDICICYFCSQFEFAKINYHKPETNLPKSTRKLDLKIWSKQKRHKYRRQTASRLKIRGRIPEIIHPRDFQRLKSLLIKSTILSNNFKTAYLDNHHHTQAHNRRCTAIRFLITADVQQSGFGNFSGVQHPK